MNSIDIFLMYTGWDINGLDDVDRVGGGGSHCYGTAVA